MIAGAANAAPNALDGCAAKTSASRHYSLSGIAQFVRGERGWTRKLKSATVGSLNACTLDTHFKIPLVGSGIDSDMARFDSTV